MFYVCFSEKYLPNNQFKSYNINYISSKLSSGSKNKYLYTIKIQRIYPVFCNQNI